MWRAATAIALGFAALAGTALLVGGCSADESEPNQPESAPAAPSGHTVTGLSTEARVEGPPGFVAVVDGEPIVVSLTSEHTLTAATITDGDYEVASSREFENPIARVEVASGSGAGLVSVVTCEVRHDPTDTDLHDPCDEGPEVVVGTVSAEGQVDFGSLPPLAGHTSSAVGWVAPDRPYLFTDRGRLVLDEAGDEWVQLPDPPQALFQPCGAGGAMFAVTSPGPAATTTSVAGGPLPADGSQQVLTYQVAEPGAEWQPLGTDGVSPALVCDEQRVAVATVSDGATTLAAVSPEGATQRLYRSSARLHSSQGATGGGEVSMWLAVDGDEAAVMADADDLQVFVVPDELGRAVDLDSTYYVDESGQLSDVRRSGAFWEIRHLETD